MPELPEVEIIVRELNRKIAGKKISRFLILDKRLEKPKLKLPSRILKVSRHGKRIVLELDCKKRCAIHLRMTGELIYDKKQPISPGPKNERATIYFSDGSALHFFDTRRFGTVDWPKRSDLPELGVDPLSKKFSRAALKELLIRSSQKIKNFLLDQKYVSGIGNIYADESLWLAKINPLRRAGNLSGAEAARLAASIKKILREAIRKGGFTLRDYRRTGGESGYYQNSRKVYNREGLPCKRCRATIKRIKIGGRSSYFCQMCQR